jgi:hypothetical protein
LEAVLGWPLTVANCTIAGNAADFGGGIANAGTMTLTDSTIAHNSARLASPAVSGGGIENDGTMTVTDSTIAYNSASDPAEDAGSGGGIDNNNGATLTVTNSTIAYNSANHGGGIFNSGTLTVTNSTIAYNSADNGGGIGGGGTMTITNSTIAHNSTDGVGCGFFLEGYGTLTVTNSTIAYNSATEGGGIGILNGTLTVTNSTIAYNSAEFGGGGISGGSLSNFGILTVTNSTIAYNSADGIGGGGISGDATLYNTIVARNANGDILGTVAPSSAYNLIGTGGSGGLVNGVDGNQVGVANPGLGPLADHGGPTQTIVLLTGSPAIDKGNNALAVDPMTHQTLNTDQRGPGFVRIVNGTVDIGAFEFTPAANDAVAAVWGPNPRRSRPPPTA